jgi:hypothetical protein
VRDSDIVSEDEIIYTDRSIDIEVFSFAGVDGTGFDPDLYIEISSTSAC